MDDRSVWQSYNSHTASLQKMEEIATMNDKQTFSNCHRTSGSKNKKTDISGASVDAEQDSSTSKYVVRDDDRERKDGPGGD